MKRARRYAARAAAVFLGGFLLTLVAVLGVTATAAMADDVGQGTRTRTSCEQNPRACTLGNHNPTAAIAIPKDVPELQRPDFVSSYLPCKAEQAPAPADPFDPKSGATLFSQYCYAGYEAAVYDVASDNGTISGPGDWVRASSRENGNALSSLMVQPGVWFTSVTDATWSAAFDTGWLTTSVHGMAQTLAHRVGPLAWKYAPLSLLVAAAFLANMVGQANVGKALASALMACLFLGMGVLALGYPSAVAEGAQVVMGQVATDMNSNVKDGAPAPGSTGGQASEATLREVHYRGWAKRTFGDPDGAAAIKFGPRLFRANTMDMAELKVCTLPPGANTGVATGGRVPNRGPGSPECQTIYNRHAVVQRKVYAELKAFDPAAYAWAQGFHQRVWPSVGETVAALGVGYVRFACAMVIIAALLCLVGAAIALPLVMLVAVVPGREVHMLGLVGAAGYAVVSGCIAAVIGPGAAVAEGTILTARHTSGLMSMMLLFVVTIVLLGVLRPWQRIRTMTSMSVTPRQVRRMRRRGWRKGRKGARKGRRLLGRVLSVGGTAAVTRAAVKSGTAAGAGKAAAGAAAGTAGSAGPRRHVAPPMAPAQPRVHVMHQQWQPHQNLTQVPQRRALTQVRSLPTRQTTRPTGYETGAPSTQVVQARPFRNVDGSVTWGADGHMAWGSADVYVPSRDDNGRFGRATARPTAYSTGSRVRASSSPSEYHTGTGARRNVPFTPPAPTPAVPAPARPATYQAAQSAAEPQYPQTNAGKRQTVTVAPPLPRHEEQA